METKKDNNIEYNAEDTIFVRISSYRDFELPCTLIDLFAKAKRPENIYVGLCHQYDVLTGQDKQIFRLPFPRSRQIRTKIVDYREAHGLCWARSEAQKLYHGEKWTAQFDAHMRFIQNWDESVIMELKQLQQQGIAKPILTCYPASYDINTSEFSISECGISVKMKDAEGIFRPSPCSNFKRYKINFVPIMLGGANVTLGKHIQEVPYDPYLNICDEANIACRSWCAGYDIILAKKMFVAHLYNVKEIEALRKYPLHSPYKDGCKLNDSKLAHAREHAIFRMRPLLKKDVFSELSKYDLPTSRTLVAYERFAGLQLATLGCRVHALMGYFEQANPILSKFTNENVWRRIYQM